MGAVKSYNSVTHVNYSSLMPSKNNAKIIAPKNNIYVAQISTITHSLQ